MSFERFVAARYLISKRKGLFTLVTTSIGIAGVMIGVAALITTLSVMNGFQTDIRAKIVGAQAHLMVYGNNHTLNRDMAESVRAKAETFPGFQASAPFVLGQAIITYQGRSTGILLKGLDPAQESNVNTLAQSLRRGEWSFRKSKASDPAAIILGEELADNLGVWLGQEVVLVSPQGMETPLGLLPKMKKFRVSGLIHTGYYEFDSSTAYADLSEAAAFFGLDRRVTGLQIKLGDLDAAEDVGKRLQTALGFDYVVRSFKQLNQPLFAALRLEKYMMTLLLTLIILVASLNIASNLILLGAEKLRDIGILKSMGATPRQIRRIFLWEGVFIGGMGVASGSVLGLILCWAIYRYPPVTLPADIYYISRVPVHVQGADVLTVIAGGFLLSLSATLYPAWRAAKVNPVEAIRYG